MYGTDVNAQLKSMGIIPDDIAAQMDAEKSGWQDTFGKDLGVAKDIGVKIPGG
jgi:hypothetical protein